MLRHLRHHLPEGMSRSVELGVAEAEEARLLERPPGSAVLVVTTAYAAQGRTAALVVATYRADTCRLAFGDEPVSVARSAS
ncbi:UTRA domain-containing protein [Yinghuangia aomiensis]